MNKLRGASCLLVGAVVLLTLAAGPALGKDKIESPAESLLIGQWITGDTEGVHEYDLRKDHTFKAKVTRASGEVSLFTGVWKYESDGYLALQGKGEKEALVTKLKSVDDNHIDHLFSAGEDLSVRRWMRVVNGVKKQPALTGIWETKLGKLDWRYEFTADGKFVMIQNEAGGKRRKGTYKHVAAGLFLLINGQLPLDYHLRWIDASTVEATYASANGKVFTWKRRGDVPTTTTQSARARFVGRWFFATPRVRVVCDLAADGSYKRKWTEKGETKPSVGTWDLEGHVLLLLGKGGKTPWRLGTEWIDDNYFDSYPANEPKTPRIRWVRPTQDVPENPDYVGTWVTQKPDHGMKVTLGKDGRYTLFRGEGDETTGTWTGTPASLFFLPDGEKHGGEEVLNVRYLDGDHFEFQTVGQGDIAVVWGREGAKPYAAAGETTPAPEPDTPRAAGPDDLIGKWIAKDEKLEVRITLNKDGTFVHILKTKSSEETTRGTWKLEKDVLVADPDKEETVYRLKWRLLDVNRLLLIDEGENETTLLQREGTKPGPVGLGKLSADAQAMVGEWLARGEAVEIRLSLRADGTFTQVIKKGDKSETTAGSFNVKGGKLLALPKDELVPTKLDCKLLDQNTLRIVDAAGTIELVRQSR